MPWGWIFAQIIRDGRSTKVAKILIVHWRLTFLQQGQGCFPMHCMGPIHLYGKKVENFKRLLLWSLWASFAQILCGDPLGQGNERLLKWLWSITKIAELPMYVKDLEDLLLQNRGCLGAIMWDRRSTKVAKMMVVRWPFYSEVKFASICICISPINLHWKNGNFKWLCLWSLCASVAQITCGASLGKGDKQLLKWSWSIDQGGCHAHIWYEPFKIYFSRIK